MSPNELDLYLIPRLESRLDAILSEVQSLKAAFPENDRGIADIEGHRRYHEAKISAAKAEEAFWSELKLDLAKKGAWSVLIVVVGLLLAGIVAKAGGSFR